MLSWMVYMTFKRLLIHLVAHPICFTLSYFAGVEGLEPPSTVLETVILPLNYTPIFDTTLRFEL